MTVPSGSAINAFDDPKPPFPADPSGEPPVEEPTDTPPEREEPGEGDDAPMIAFPSGTAREKSALAAAVGRTDIG